MTSRESLEDFTSEIDINLTGPVRLAQLFLPDLKRRANAAIVNVTSGLAFVPLPISPIYCATKAALHSFTLSLRAQLARCDQRQGVRDRAARDVQTDLLGSFQAGDLEGTSVMNLQKMVQLCLKGLSADRLEIRPGQSNLLKLMNRLAPDFILSQLSKPVARMLEG